MFKTRFSKKTLLTIVNNNKLYFIEFDKHGNESLFHSMSLDQFLSDDPDAAIIVIRRSIAE